MMTIVKTTENTSVPHNSLFCFLSLKSDSLLERRLKLWKTSIIESVRNAIVIPFCDINFSAAIPAVTAFPSAKKTPSLYDITVITAITKP